MRRYRKQAGSSLGRRAQRGAIAMGMMAQSGRRSAFRGQSGGPTCQWIGHPVSWHPNVNWSSPENLSTTGCYPWMLGQASDGTTVIAQWTPHPSGGGGVNSSDGANAIATYESQFSPTAKTKKKGNVSYVNACGCGA